MNGWYWKYSVTAIENSHASANQDTGVKITPANQQVMKVIYLRLQHQTGVFVGHVVRVINETSVSIIELANEAETTFMLPNSHYLSQFQKPSIEDLLIMDGDRLDIFSDNLEASGTFDLEIRAMVNICARPTITGYGTDTVIPTPNYNKIIGVIE